MTLFKVLIVFLKETIKLLELLKNIDDCLMFDIIVIDISSVPIHKKKHSKYISNIFCKAFKIP